MNRLLALAKALRRGVVLGLLCAVIAWLLCLPGLVRGVEEWLFDGWFHWRGSRPTQARVVLIGLDETSLNELGKPAAFLSPELATVITWLKAQGAAAIGLDLIVPASMEDTPYEQYLQADKLGQAIYEANNVVLSKRLLRATADNQPDDWLLPLTQWRFKMLTDRARPTDIGFVDIEADRDQFVRSQRLFSRKGDMHFALALYALATGQPVRWENGLWAGDRPVPLDDQQRLRINYVGPPGSFPVVPFREALAAARNGQPASVDLAGAIAIIGVTSKSHQDYHATPYGNRFYLRMFNEDAGLMAGSEIHGHIIATLADQAYLRTLPGPTYLALLLLFGAVLGQVFLHTNLETGPPIALAHHFGWLALSLLMFIGFRLRVEMLAMLLLGVLAYTATFSLRWRRLRRMLGMVKSEAIAQVIEGAATPLELKGEVRVVTVLFADIRGFTDFSERHTPAQAVALLNGYFSVIVPIIEAHGGTLSQYIGDGIMVIFGAPAVRLDHALQAVQAAREMIQRVHQLRERWKELDYPGFRIGIGIHTGEVLMGAVGSPHRLDYTAIGDTVNAASRIEAENKRLGTEILLSAQTYAALPAAERERLEVSPQVEPLLVKGKQQTLEVHRLNVGPEGAPQEELASRGA